MVNKCTVITTKGKKCTLPLAKGHDTMCARHVKLAKDRENETNGGDAANNMTDGWEGEQFFTVPLPSHHLNAAELQTLADINRQIDIHKDALKVLRREKRMIVMRTVLVENKARWMFYQSKKKDETILADLRMSLKKGNLYVVKGKKEVLPYTLIKEYTDRMYDALDASIKAEWIAKATPLPQA